MKKTLLFTNSTNILVQFANRKYEENSENVLPKFS